MNQWELYTYLKLLKKEVTVQDLVKRTGEQTSPLNRKLNQLAEYKLLHKQGSPSRFCVKNTQN